MRIPPGLNPSAQALNGAHPDVFLLGGIGAVMVFPERGELLSKTGIKDMSVRSIVVGHIEELRS